MPNFQDLCNSLDRQGIDAALLREACALPRSAADLSPLPEPRSAAVFDSAWEVLLVDQRVNQRT